MITQKGSGVYTNIRMRSGSVRLTTESSSAGAVVATRHVLAEAPIHARVGLTLVVVEVAVGPAPARVTETFVPTRRESQVRAVQF